MRCLFQTCRVTKRAGSETVESDSDTSYSEDSQSTIFDSTDEDDTEQLSFWGQKAREQLRKKQWHHHKASWNVTHGTIAGKIMQTPPHCTWGSNDIRGGHSDEFPKDLFRYIHKAKEWIDITTLAPPDGAFKIAFLDALAKLAENLKDTDNHVIIRIMFGRIPGAPVDCNELIEEYTENISENSKMSFWIGAWRSWISWNHSKIIAVDGKYLVTGGHNMWDPHYLRKDPVHDVSMAFEGQVADCGHVFANKMWKHVNQQDSLTWIYGHIPHWLPLASTGRVCIAHYPEHENDHPPMYKAPDEVPMKDDEVPMITCGRLGNLHRYVKDANPSDTAIVALFQASQKIIKLSLQDLGPVTLPLPYLPGQVKKAVPGGRWPANYLNSIGRAIYKRGVDIEIVLSNPESVPNDLSPLEAIYGNGWSCVDVAAEIIKAIQRQFPRADEPYLRRMVQENLRVTFLRTGGTGSSASGGVWRTGGRQGNHAKFFIVDDSVFYIGSQNLYDCNLAEWGVIVDDKEATRNVLEEYWNPMWKYSYEDVKVKDVDVDQVMDSLGIDRGGVEASFATPQERAGAMEAFRRANKVTTKFHDIDELQEHFHIDHGQ